MSLTLSKAFAAITCIYGISDVPKIQDLSYPDARVKLLASGWMPAATIEEDSAQFTEAYWLKKGFKEVEACLPTGRGGCIFNFKKDRTCLRVWTIGAQDDTNGLSQHVGGWSDECPRKP